MNAPLKFLADASLAGLVRWLRLLGFDAEVYSGPAGRPMMKMALCEQRIVLTRRRDMMERQFSGKMLLIPEFSTSHQLHFVINQLHLSIRSEKNAQQMPIMQ